MFKILSAQMCILQTFKPLIGSRLATTQFAVDRRETMGRLQ
jgi:hypothetical protein